MTNTKMFLGVLVMISLLIAWVVLNAWAWDALVGHSLWSLFGLMVTSLVIPGLGYSIIKDIRKDYP